MKKGYYRKRHERLFRALKWLVEPFFRHMLAYSYEPIPKIDGPCIVLANHNTDFDPILISFASHKLMYFVTSEHVMRSKLVKGLLTYLFAPISRVKGSVASSTVMQILRRLRDGHTVCMFAEGNRSFDGRTCEILPATSKVVKSSGATLVTFRFTGGYFTSPRWSTHVRRGKLSGAPVHVYTPAELKSMTANEIYDTICRDLHEDAYDRQAEQPIEYRGKKLAEALETMLFLCPKCGRIGTLESRDDHLVCSCGLDVTYSSLGYLSFSGMRTVPQWDAWQQEQLLAMADTDPTFCLQDADVALSHTETDGDAVLLHRGEIRMTADSLSFGDNVFPIANIQSLALCGRSIMEFSVGENHYEVRSKTRYCARKYLLWFTHLKAQQVS